MTHSLPFSEVSFRTGKLSCCCSMQRSISSALKDKQYEYLPAQPIHCLKFGVQTIPPPGYARAFHRPSATPIFPKYQSPSDHQILTTKSTP